MTEKEMEINEKMGHTIMRDCRVEDYGELHRLLIGRVAYTDGLDEGNTLLHDIADILKMAMDDFPRGKKMKIKDASGVTSAYFIQNPARHQLAVREWYEKWFEQPYVEEVAI